MKTNPSIQINVEFIDGKAWSSFELQLSPKQTRKVLLHPGGQISVTGSVMQQAYSSGGKYFGSFQEARDSYKCKKMLACMDFIPEYIEQGLTGKIEVIL